mmetsp:Transcript_13992/g.24528  ORF Transcript_13992/g.24528 Transcript_13992/m.24528 type:complete len:189 (+) Transcript_13992:81-647(+)
MKLLNVLLLVNTAYAVGLKFPQRSSASSSVTSPSSSWTCKELSVSEKVALEGSKASFLKRSKNFSNDTNVLAVGAIELSALLQHENLLIVFWHPACPTCNLYCAEGNSPIEDFHDRLADEKGPRVVKYNLYYHPLPDAFKTGEATIQVPRLQLGNNMGAVGNPFSGNMFSYTAVRAWVVQNGMLPASS